MNTPPLIEIEELNKQITVCDSFLDEILVADLDGETDENRNETMEDFVPIRLNALVIVLVLKGTSKIEIDYIPYTLGANSFVTIMPTHIIQPVYVSPDFKGRMIVASKSFLQDCFPERRDPSMVHYMQIKKNPCAQFEPDEIKHLDRYILQLREKIKLRTHFFQKQVLQNSFMAFFLELADISVGKEDFIAPSALSRKEELFERFLQLLFKNCKEQHSVTFYAEALCITPQYLSLVLKEISGKSANKWIDDALIVEAKIMLKTPKVTVQQVADMLYFSDQSTFGKFFKKHMGISPAQYRKSR